MVKTPWLKNGVPVLIDGKPVLCSTCPCGAAGCFDHCEDGFIPTTIQVVIGGGFADAQCAGGECNAELPGTYLLDLKYIEEGGDFPTIPPGPFACTNAGREVAFGFPDINTCALWCYYKPKFIVTCEDNSGPPPVPYDLDLTIWLQLAPTYWCLEMILWFSGLHYTRWVWEASRTDKSNCRLEDPLNLAKGETNCGGVTEQFGVLAGCTTAGPDPITIQAA